MTSTRQDSWTESDDITLTQTVLGHIRRGSTQLAAFDEVATLLNRTSAACGFRWNATLRKQYVSEIKSAKQERLGSNKRPARERLSEKRLVESEATVKHPLMAIIKSLEKYIQTDNRPRNDESFMAIIEQKDREIERLQRELEVAREAEYAVTEDYRALLKILERARSLGITQAAEEDAKPVFKMDANGNLERIG